MEIIKFPDVEDELRKAIKAEAVALGHPGLEAYTSRPKMFPDVLVVVTRTGGANRDMVTDAPLVSIDIYARRSGSPHEGAAVALADTLRAWVNALSNRGTMGPVTVYESSTISGPYRNPDPLAPEHARFTINVALAVRGRSVIV